MVWCKCKKKKQFHFEDKVKILSGFYKGITGTLNKDFNDGTYLITLDDSWRVIIISGKLLKLITKGDK